MKEKENLGSAQEVLGVNPRPLTAGFVLNNIGESRLVVTACVSFNGSIRFADAEGDNPFLAYEEALLRAVPQLRSVARVDRADIVEGQGTAQLQIKFIGSDYEWVSYVRVGKMPIDGKLLPVYGMALVDGYNVPVVKGMIKE